MSSGDHEAIPSKDRKKKGLSKSRSTVGGDDQIEYKAGWVVRKCLYDSDGKRSKCYRFDFDITLFYSLLYIPVKQSSTLHIVEM